MNQLQDLNKQSKQLDNKTKNNQVITFITNPRATISNIILRVKIQKMIKIWIKRMKKSKHRLMILKQWQKTQQSYYKDLEIIAQKIHKPFINNKLINSQQQLILFPNMSSMKQLSLNMLNQLRIYIKQWHPLNTCIGSKMIYFHKFFIIYREYCNNFFKGQQIVKKIRLKPQAASIQSSLMMDFQSYLIKPVQRPSKYQLLLREYQKCMVPTHKDYKPLLEAISKYHQVNQQNNKSMDFQIRTQKMIKLQHTYNGIISNSRYYISQHECETDNIKIKLYLFNDLLLLTKIDDNSQYLKIYLNGSSYVQKLNDCKYFKNKLFICGTRQNAHLNFNKNQQRDKLYQILSKIILEIFYRDNQRKSIMVQAQNRKRNSNIVRLTVIQQKLNKIIYQPNFRIIVDGVQKLKISTFSTQTYYIIRLKTSYPDQMLQYIYFQWHQLINLQNCLLAQKTKFHFPLLEKKANNISYYDVKKNKSQIIQYRAICIQRFLNYIFRSQEILGLTQIIKDIIRINKWIWDYSTTGVYQRDCQCRICENMPNITSLDHYMALRDMIIEQLKNKRFSRRQSQQRQSQRRSNLSTKTSSQIRQIEESKGCIYWAFKNISLIKQIEGKQLKTLQTRLLWLDYKLGRIDYSILRYPPTSRPYKIKVYLLSNQQNSKYNQIEIDKFTLVYDVLQEIRDKYRLKTIKDFGLFLEYNQLCRILDQDQCLYQTLLLANCPIQEVSNDNSGFFAKLGKDISQFKNWGKDKIIGQSGRLYIKKYITIHPEIEIEECKNNYSRTQLLIQQISYRIKNQFLFLGVEDIKKACALYYILKQISAYPQIALSSLEQLKIQQILPQNKHSLLNKSFINDIYYYIQSQQQKEVDYSKKKQTIQLRIIEFMLQKIQLGWGSTYFTVKNYQTKVFREELDSVTLAVNYKYLIIFKKKHLQPLLQIPLHQLNYKVTVFSIVIYYDQKEYRFDQQRQTMYNIKKVIEKYQCYNLKFV